MANNNNANPTPEQQQQQQTPEHVNITEGIVGLFHTISGTKTKIVYTNLFTGKIHVKSGGFFFNFPWRRKPVKISLDQHKIDTICRKTTTLGTGGNSVGPMVDYDTDYFIKVVDPEKFMDVAYSTSPDQIKKNIGDILDQKIQDFIRIQDYDSLIRQSSVDFLSQIGSRDVNGVFPANSLNQELLENYGLEVTRLTFKVRPPQELIAEVTRTKQAEQAARTAEQESRRRQIEAQGQAEVTRIHSAAEAEKIRLEGEALAQNIAAWIASGMTNEQIAKKLANHELVNGRNEHTIIMAAADQAQQQAGSGAFNATLMMQLFNQMMQQHQAQQQVQQPPQQQVQQQTQQQQQPTSTVNWAVLPDDEYLSAEDSVSLAAERGQTIAPGGRYHISLLTDEEKTRYHVAAQRGNTR